MALKIIGWAAYVFIALIGTLLAFESGAWFGLAVALCFIFGPKLWKMLS